MRCENRKSLIPRQNLTQARYTRHMLDLKDAAFDEARFSLKTTEFGDWLLPAFLASAPGFGSLEHS